MEEKNTQSESKSSAIDKLFDIVECIHANGGKAKINKISSDLDLYKSTVHRILSTLKERGYVYQDSNDLSYGIGPKFYFIGQMFQKNYSFVPLLSEAATEMGAIYGECVQISTLNNFSDGEPTQISVFRTNAGGNILNAVPELGSISPSHCSASGKCLLAFSDNSVLEKYKKCTLKKFTENTITDWDRLQEELRNVRSLGYSRDKDELEIGLSCVAVPIIINGSVVAAISMLGATARFDTYDIEKIVADLKGIVSNLSF